MDNPEVIAPIVVAVIMAIPGVLALYMQRRKEQAGVEQTEADAAGKVTGAALALIRPYQERMTEMQAELDKHDKTLSELLGCKRRIDSMQQELREWQDGVLILIQQLKDLGEIPQWKPMSGRKNRDG